MREIFIALISSSLAILGTSFFNYYFLMRKEFRMQANSYKIEILQNIYTPIVKLLNKEVFPGDGYEGITFDTFSSIEEIVNNHYQLVSPELDSIIWSLKEEINHGWHHSNEVRLDEDRALVDHVEFNFNFYRKELGLPYDKISFQIEKKKVKKAQKSKGKQRLKSEKIITDYEKQKMKRRRKRSTKNG